jgi:hypothetical protein
MCPQASSSPMRRAHCSHSHEAFLSPAAGLLAHLMDLSKDTHTTPHTMHCMHACMPVCKSDQVVMLHTENSK